MQNGAVTTTADEAERSAQVAEANDCGQVSGDEADEGGEDEELEESWFCTAKVYDWDADQSSINLQHGLGTMTISLQEKETADTKQARYVGSFINGKPHGHGVERSDDGLEIWRDQWKYGMLHGLGERHYRNGMHYRGTFDEGEVQGPGSSRESDGTDLVHGTWAGSGGSLRLQRRGVTGWPLQFNSRLRTALSEADRLEREGETAAKRRAQRRAEAEAQAAQAKSSYPPESKIARTYREALAYKTTTGS